MRNSFLYLSEGKMFLHTAEGEREIASGVLSSYLSKLRESSERNEWKYSGEGARFTGTFEPGTDAESRLAAVRSQVLCIGREGNDLIYSLRIDNTAGIYRKHSVNDGNEGIVISSGNVAYREFDIAGERMAVAVARGDECHIGVMKPGDPDCEVYTDGRSWDFSPAWSAVNPDQLYFCTAGLKVRRGEENADAEREVPPMGLSQVFSAMMSEAGSVGMRGPASLCLLDTRAGTLREIYADRDFDFVHPQSLPDGSLYYIRRPYKSREPGRRPFGCLVDLFLFPVRLIGALFGFFNVFSIKYSGKTLSNAGDAKRKDESRIFIDGNLIEAEKELKANRGHGEEIPGIIPRSWELRRRLPDGTDELIRRGVVAYSVDPTSGEILFSNGSAILSRQPSGKETRVAPVSYVTMFL